MSNMVEALLYQVANAQVRAYPYPHIYIPDVFPADFYAELQAKLPDPAAMIPIEDARPVRGYKERFVLAPANTGGRLPAQQGAFWADVNTQLTNGRFRQALLAKFQPTLVERFGQTRVRLYEETLLVEDITHYALGPHTDSPSKVLTVLFYLPRDTSQSHLGTSIYMPKDGSRRCPGGPHYGYEGFHRVATMPFVPNAMFAFPKTDASFHGVEPVTDPDVRRWLLLYDIKHTVVEAPATSAGPAAAETGAG